MGAEWQTATLADLCTEVSYGYTESAQDTPVGPKFLRITDIQNGIVDWPTVPYCAIEARKLPNYLLRRGDIVIARTGNSTGENYVFDCSETAVFASYLIRYRIDDAKANPFFVWYQLRTKKWWDFVASSKTGSAQAGANAQVLGKFEIATTSREVQDRIVDYLKTIDRKIDLNRLINQTLEAMAQAIFKSWFVDFDPVKAKIAAKKDGRDPMRAAMSAISGKFDAELTDLPREQYDQLAATAALFPDEMEDSDLEEIPKGWYISALGEECSYLNRGISPKYLDQGGVLVLNQKCIRGFAIDSSRGRRHDPAQRSVNGRLLQLGDVLVNSTGVGTLGRVAQVLWLDEPTIVDSHVTVVRVGERLNSAFLGQWFALKQNEIEALGEGSTGQTELSRGKLADMPVLVPEGSLLNVFDANVAPLKSLISTRDRESLALQKARDALLPRLLSGELKAGVEMEGDEA